VSAFTISSAQVSQFKEDGYLLVPHLFDGEEIDLLSKIARADARLAGEARERRDAAGAKSRLALRNELGEDIYSACARSQRVAGTMEMLLEDEVYHWHHKMMMKEPNGGGAWEWHQDYGYWYNNYCLFPDMGSCMIAVDQANRDNGCLEVIRGSHKLGRIDHAKVGDQTAADPERVKAALQRMEHIYCEMEPGDALFFHANLLHRSGQNFSPRPRWVLICCYNTAHNDPFREIPGGHPRYSPLEKWTDTRVREVGLQQWERLQKQSD